MDTLENSDQILQKLSNIEKQLRSLRYIFGTGIIVMAVFLAFLAPTLVRDFSDQNSWGVSSAVSAEYDAVPVAEAPSAPVVPAPAAPLATTTTATATTTP